MVTGEPQPGVGQQPSGEDLQLPVRVTKAKRRKAAEKPAVPTGEEASNAAAHAGESPVAETGPEAVLGNREIASWALEATPASRAAATAEAAAEAEAGQP